MVNRGELASPCGTTAFGLTIGMVALHAAREPFPETYFDFPVK